MVNCKLTVWCSWSTTKLFPPNFMWCSCSVCNQWRKLNTVAFKFILPRHRGPCNCTCVFCDGDCQSLERLSPRYLSMSSFSSVPFIQCFFVWLGLHIQQVQNTVWPCCRIMPHFCYFYDMIPHYFSIITYSFRTKRGDLSWICRSRHRMEPHGHLSQMTGRDQDTSRDASHRLARFQKRYWYFLNFSRL